MALDDAFADFARRDWERDAPAGTVRFAVVESGDVRMEYTGPPVDEVREEFDYFGYCALTDTEPEPDGADALADLRAIEAAYESAETGCRVEFE